MPFSFTEGGYAAGEKLYGTRLLNKARGMREIAEKGNINLLVDMKTECIRTAAAAGGSRQRTGIRRWRATTSRNHLAIVVAAVAAVVPPCQIGFQVSVPPIPRRYRYHRHHRPRSTSRPRSLVGPARALDNPPALPSHRDMYPAIAVPVARLQQGPC